MQPFGRCAGAAGLVGRDKRTDEAQIDHGKDIGRLHIRIEISFRLDLWAASPRFRAGRCRWSRLVGTRSEWTRSLQMAQSWCALLTQNRSSVWRMK
jgi:hypothetical protein